jgi:hypothetical protein
MTTRDRVSYVRDIPSGGVTTSFDGPITTDKTVDISDSVMSADEVRFWSHVNKDGPVGTRRPELGPCWMWTGASGVELRTGKHAYGQTTYRGKRMPAHVASFLMHGGVLPTGYDVMHDCDTKPCVRPSHIRAGTRSENLRDGFANPANAGVCAGENNGRARLTWDDVHAIRAARKAGASQPDLARRYGVTQVQISHIVRGTRWPESKCPLHARTDVAA